jgi:hypothetical protein
MYYVGLRIFAEIQSAFKILSFAGGEIHGCLGRFIDEISTGLSLLRSATFFTLTTFPEYYDPMHSLRINIHQ